MRTLLFSGILLVFIKTAAVARDSDSELVFSVRIEGTRYEGVATRLRGERHYCILLHEGTITRRYQGGDASKILVNQQVEPLTHSPSVYFLTKDNALVRIGALEFTGISSHAGVPSAAEYALKVYLERKRAEQDVEADV